LKKDGSVLVDLITQLMYAVISVVMEEYFKISIVMMEILKMEMDVVVFV
jgi:hypothetical protein